MYWGPKEKIATKEKIKFAGQLAVIPAIFVTIAAYNWYANNASIISPASICAVAFGLVAIVIYKRVIP